MKKLKINYFNKIQMKRIFKSIFFFIKYLITSLLFFIFKCLKFLFFSLLHCFEKIILKTENLEEIAKLNSLGRLSSYYIEKYLQKKNNLRISISYFRGDPHFSENDFIELLKSEKIMKSR